MFTKLIFAHVTSTGHVMKELRVYKPQVSHCILYMYKSYLVYIQVRARKSSHDQNYRINQG